MITLFAFTKDPAQRLARFELDASLQTELTEYFELQAAEFDRCDEVLFDGNYRPDSDECLYISDFDDIDALSEAVANPMTVPVAAQTESLLQSIKSLFFGINGPRGWVVYLQAFDRRRLISNKGFSIFHSGDVYKRLEGTGLTIDHRVVAKLDGQKLSFRSFFLARQIFDLSIYYQEATDADITEFANISQVKVTDIDQFKEISDSWVRRKVWLIQQSKILEKVPPDELRVAAEGFKLEINHERDAEGAEQLVIPSDKRQLKSLLRFLDEDYYTSPLSKTNFMTNSKVQLE